MAEQLAFDWDANGAPAKTLLDGWAFEGLSTTVTYGGKAISHPGIWVPVPLNLLSDVVSMAREYSVAFAEDHAEFLSAEELIGIKEEDEKIAKLQEIVDLFQSTSR